LNTATTTSITTRDAGSRHGWYGEMTPQVAAFLERLRRIPAEAWATAADRDPHIAPADAATDDGQRAMQFLRDLETDQLARARLRDVMEAMPDVVRRIRRRVDEDLTVLDGIASKVSLSRMRRSARLAACALAARPHLSVAEFERLYRPFRTLIPLEELAPADGNWYPTASNSLPPRRLDDR
jgi:hypothetical protein